MSIQAIQTRYKGYRFRSRLEARWAVFFDALDVEWSYETEGFAVSKGCGYLPDFRINRIAKFIVIKKVVALKFPEHLQHFQEFPLDSDLTVLADNVTSPGWLEVKPTLETPEKQVQKIISFAEKLENSFLISARGDPYDMNLFCLFPRVPKVGGAGCAIFGGSDGRLGLLVQGLECSEGQFWEAWKQLKPDGLMAAAERSRSARFEHGETP